MDGRKYLTKNATHLKNLSSRNAMKSRPGLTHSSKKRKKLSSDSATLKEKRLSSKFRKLLKNVMPRS